MRSLSFTIFAFAIIILAGCNAGSMDTPVLPLDNIQNASAPPSGRSLWGLYTFTFDRNATDPVVIAPVRSGSFHLNIRKYLEVSPCHNCINLSGVEVTPTGFNVNIAITHPFPPTSKFYGFDVRGIFFFDGALEFPSLDVTAPSPLLGDGYLANPDGYATIFNAVEYHGDNILSYSKGHFVPPGMPDPNATLGAFRAYFSNGQSEVDGGRRAFFPGDTVGHRYEIVMPGNGPFTYGYAIDSSWDVPLNHPVQGPEDFPPTANIPEPFRIDVNELSNTLYTTGGSVRLEIIAFDHQNSGSILECSAEAPGLTDQVITDNLPVSFGLGTTRFELEIPNDLGAASPAGEEILIRILHDEPDPNFGIIPAWSFHIANVIQLPANPHIDSIVPDTGSQGTIVTAEISGIGFVEGASVQLYQGIISIDGYDITIPDPFTINVSFYLNGPIGYYTLYVENPGGAWGELPDAFVITPP